MNWAPEALKAEMDYRVERAIGDPRDGTTREHLRAARAQHQSWWQRYRAAHHHAAHHDETSGSPRAA